jgi:positive regulator of sigma E activity
VGWQFRVAYKDLAQQISRIEEIVILGIIITIVGFFIYRKYYKNVE